MKLFFFKFMLVVVTMLLCVLFGIQYANKGIEMTRGFEPFIAEGTDDLMVTTTYKKEEQAVIDRQVDQEEQLNEIDGTNFFSTAGKKISYLLSEGTNYLLDKIHLLLNKIIF